MKVGGWSFYSATLVQIAANRHGGDGLTVGLTDLRGLFQP